MREIRFRAWDGTKMHHEGFGVTCEGTPTIGYVSHEIDLRKKDSFRLMQFTGLKDKNGKEIYEGDVLKFDGNRNLLTVRYDDFGVPCACNDEFMKSWDFAMLGAEGSFKQCAVIGNIYENPERVKNG